MFFSINSVVGIPIYFIYSFFFLFIKCLIYKTVEILTHPVASLCPKLVTVPLCTAPMTIYGLDHHTSPLAYTKKINTILKLLRIWSRFSFQVLIQTNLISYNI